MILKWLALIGSDTKFVVLHACDTMHIGWNEDVKHIDGGNVNAQIAEGWDDWWYIIHSGETSISSFVGFRNTASNAGGGGFESKFSTILNSFPNTTSFDPLQHQYSYYDPVEEFGYSSFNSSHWAGAYSHNPCTVAWMEAAYSQIEQMTRDGSITSGSVCKIVPATAIDSYGVWGIWWFEDLGKYLITSNIVYLVYKDDFANGH